MGSGTISIHTERLQISDAPSQFENTAREIDQSQRAF